MPDANPYFFNVDRQIVQGVFRADGARYYRKLCTFEDAHIAEDGSLLKDWSDKKRDAYLKPLWLEAEGRLAADVVEKAKPRAVKVALGEWIKASEAWKAKGTITGYELFRDQYIEAVGTHDVAAFEDPKARARIVDALVGHLKERKTKKGGELSPHSINNRLNSLKAFLRWLHEREEIKTLPRLKLLKASKREPGVWEFADLGLMWAKMVERFQAARSGRERQSARCGMRAMALALGTGARAAEIWAAPWAHLTLEDEAWFDVRESPGFRVKEGKEKRVAIAASAAQFLSGERESAKRGGKLTETWVLDDGHGKRMFKTANSLENYFGRLLRELGLNGKAKTFHGFRAWYITSALQRGMDLAAVSMQVGHSQMNTTAGYMGRVSRFKQTVARGVGEELLTGSQQDFLAPLKALNWEKKLRG